MPVEGGSHPRCINWLILLLWHCISMTMCVKNRWVSSLCSLEPHHEWWPPGHRVETSTCETTFSCQSSVSRVCIPETMLISWRPLVTMLTMVTIPRMLLSTALHCHKSRNKSSSSSPPHTALSYYSSNLLSIPLVNFFFCLSCGILSWASANIFSLHHIR